MAARKAATLPSSVFNILLALGDGELHGYAIMSRVEQLTDGHVVMGPGTLYGSIKRMLADGLIEEIEARPDPELDDERRRYYRVTVLGAQARAGEIVALGVAAPERVGLIEVARRVMRTRRARVPRLPLAVPAGVPTPIRRLDAPAPQRSTAPRFCSRHVVPYRS